MVREEKGSTERLPVSVRAQAVYISDEAGTEHGSGLLYYPGAGDFFFVFTCTHVIEHLDPILLHIPIPLDAEKDDYRYHSVRIPASQAASSPDEADVTVLYANKREWEPIPSNLVFENAARSTELTAVGYPFPCEDGQLLYAQEQCAFSVVANTENLPMFELTVVDSRVDPSHRADELEGFSGAPLYSYAEDTLKVHGFVSRTHGRDAAFGRVRASKWRYVHSIMKEHFHILLESGLLGIPKQDIAPMETNAPQIGTIPAAANEQTAWIRKVKEDAMAYASDLKLGKAIELAEHAIRDARYADSDRTEKFYLLQTLAFVYRISRQYEECERVRNLMAQISASNGQIMLNQCLCAIETNDFQAAKQYAEQALAVNPNGVMERLCACLCELHLTQIPDISLLHEFIDDRERLICTCEGEDVAAFCYQMIGYVYNRVFGLKERAIRCLNRSYKIDGNLVVCETLACTYFDYAMRNAHINDTMQIDPQKIDQRELYKARECFLNVLDCADEVYLKGFTERCGLVAFDVFFFLNDTYRVLDFYPKLMRHLPADHPGNNTELLFKYLQVLAQSGSVPAEALAKLGENERSIVQAMAANHSILNVLYARSRAELRKDPNFEAELRKTIAILEGASRLPCGQTKPFTVMLMNLYANGIQLYGWRALEHVRELYAKFLTYPHEGLEESVFSAFLFELEHGAQEAKKVYQTLFAAHPSLLMWHEVLHFYVRNELLNEAEAWYIELFDRHHDWVMNQPEYAVRGFLDFLTSHQRNLGLAMRYFLHYRASFDDREIAAFLESQLYEYSNHFNCPEQMEQLRRSFFDKGLIPPQDFYRFNTLSYMLNLNRPKAESFADLIEPKIVSANDRVLTHYLTWQGWKGMAQRPYQSDPLHAMSAARVPVLMKQFRQETWRKSPEEILADTAFVTNRQMVMDAWALFLLAAEERLQLLQRFDTVFVNHFAVAVLLEELFQRENPCLRTLLTVLERADNVRLQSPDFEAQISVREKTGYGEPISAVALAQELNCPAMLGAANLFGMLNCFSQHILRPTDWVHVERLL